MTRVLGALFVSEVVGGSIKRRHGPALVVVGRTVPEYVEFAADRRFGAVVGIEFFFLLFPLKSKFPDSSKNNYTPSGM